MCGNGQIRMVAQGCAACVRRTKCGYDMEIKLHNRTTFYFPRQSLKCHDNSTIFAHIANLALLHSFFLILKT